MTKTTNHDDLAEGIERLVREYISTIHITAQAAVKRAIGAGVASDGGAKVKHVRAPAASRPGTRRASDEIGTLSERFYEVLCRMPGETMTVLAPAVGATSRELHRPMTLLKRAGRVRSVGTRHATRYFPTARDAQRGSA
ncbi:MAG: winged helix-turn-helix domain-containing protein [Polyangiales bacterium]